MDRSNASHSQRRAETAHGEQLPVWTRWKGSENSHRASACATKWRPLHEKDHRKEGSRDEAVYGRGERRPQSVSAPGSTENGAGQTGGEPLHKPGARRREFDLQELCPAGRSVDDHLRHHGKEGRVRECEYVHGRHPGCGDAAGSDGEPPRRHQLCAADHSYRHRQKSRCEYDQFQLSETRRQLRCWDWYLASNKVASTDFYPWILLMRFMDTHPYAASER